MVSSIDGNGSLLLLRLNHGRVSASGSLIDCLEPLNGDRGGLDEFAADAVRFVFGECLSHFFEQDVSPGHTAFGCSAFAFGAHVLGEVPPLCTGAVGEAVLDAVGGVLGFSFGGDVGQHAC
ncbi:hypothetical protein [Amycolatopsis vastitatis]|uniref:Uncharacterized protein n=1 Tax=Amycolatopsis vastitatis TaxID=1905142 RepID=A0A229SL63_9PSEU|nr:hypothetical protein [Amycolatopsis vastitatis]OXM59489.1 hypothetical protein CF165_47550 [Amycolatopsis vastitatis]